MEKDWKKIETELKRPFVEDKISYRVANPPKKGESWNTSKKYELLAYIDSRDVMDRLDEVVGVQNWEDIYKVLDDQNVECTLTIDGVTKTDVGERTNFADMKGGYSDAFKRAAVKFGVGRFLYDLPKKWSYVDQWGTPVNTAPTTKPTVTSQAPTASVEKPVGNNKVFCKDCKAEMTFKESSNKAGRLYSGYFCPNSKANDREHHKPFQFEWHDEIVEADEFAE